jgi:hypothetical protein
MMADDRRMDAQRSAGLTDQELIVFSMRGGHPFLCAGDANRRARLLSELDRNDVVAARNRLERRYGMLSLPISED